MPGRGEAHAPGLHLQSRKHNRLGDHDRPLSRSDEGVFGFRSVLPARYAEVRAQALVVLDGLFRGGKDVVPVPVPLRAALMMELPLLGIPPFGIQVHGLLEDLRHHDPRTGGRDHAALDVHVVAVLLGEGPVDLAEVHDPGNGRHQPPLPGVDVQHQVLIDGALGGDRVPVLAAAVVGRGLIADRIDPVVPQHPKDLAGHHAFPHARLGHTEDRFDGQRGLAAQPQVPVDLRLQQGVPQLLDLLVPAGVPETLSVADYALGVTDSATSLAWSPSNHSNWTSAKRTSTGLRLPSCGALRCDWRG